MDEEIIEKYRSGITNEYRLVYFSEGKDDPFGDMPIAAQEIGSEIAIDLVGEVTMATAMDEEISKVMASYSGGNDDDDDEPVNSYFRSGFSNNSGYGPGGSSPDIELSLAPQMYEEDEEVSLPKETNSLVFECPTCLDERPAPGLCDDCSSVIRLRATSTI